MAGRIPWGENRTLKMKRSKRYSDDGCGGSNDNGKTAHRQVEWQRCVDDDDFLDGIKDDKQQEIR